jgi:hypothetical protein
MAGSPVLVLVLMVEGTTATWVVVAVVLGWVRR